MNKVLLSIKNVQNIKSGLLPYHQFNEDGGVVGASNTCDWILADSANSIQSQHFEIFYIDHSFCLKDLSGRTYINGSDMPLGVGNSARLQHKDEIAIGKYSIEVKFVNEHQSDDDLFSLNDLIKSEEPEVLNHSLTETHEPVSIKKHAGIDPVFELDKTLNNEDKKDGRDDDLISNDLGSLSLNDTNKEPHDKTFQSDCEFEINSPMKLKKILGFNWFSRKDENQSQQSNDFIKEDLFLDGLEGNDMNDSNELDYLEKELAKELDSSEFGNGNHLVTGPVYKGLEMKIASNSDVEFLHNLGEEIGASLRACVQGILDINAQAKESRFCMINKNLQPIEDNPLRLGLNYEQTMNVLFDKDKSSVHLSAPSAIEESLNNIIYHNQAMQEAVTESLQHILLSFSPKVLLARFSNYKRVHDLGSESNDEWAWKMYENYFQELTSERQSGFDKLFWEIFEQAYDRKIREKQMEL